MAENMSAWIDVTAPGVLPLAMVKRPGTATPAALGAALKHVPAQLSARTAARPSVTGGRAPFALAQAERFAAHHKLQQAFEIEIEWSIAARMGFGSDAVLGLSVARALAVLNDLPLDATSLAGALDLTPMQRLEMAAFDWGGLLLVEMPTDGQTAGGEPLLHHALEHKERDAWAFVMFQPNPPDDSPRSLEADRAAALMQIGPHLSDASGEQVEAELWPAFVADDIRRFGRALMAIQAQTLDALGRAGHPTTYSAVEQSILDLFRDNGAQAWGRSLTGLALYGLVQGEKTASDLKKKLLALMGHHAGTTMASTIDGQGARHKSRADEFQPRVGPL